MSRPRTALVAAGSVLSATFLVGVFDIRSPKPNGDASVFFTRPLSLIIIILTVLALFVPYHPRIVARLRGPPTTA
jgi:hypothetical protein